MFNNKDYFFYLTTIKGTPGIVLQSFQKFNDFTLHFLFLLETVKVLTKLDILTHGIRSNYSAFFSAKNW